MANDILVLLVTFRCGGMGSLVGGGGMPGLGAVAADGVAARRDLARPLVLRGEGKVRKSTSLCSAPEVLETWLVCSTPSMSEGSWELSSGMVGSEPGSSTPCGGRGGGALPPLDTHCA